MIYTSNPSSISLECRRGRSLVQVALWRERKREGKKRMREREKDTEEVSEKLRQRERVLNGDKGRNL